jgi:FHA domain
MSIYKCPKGHESTEPDYCSECGTKILGVAELASTANPVPATVTHSTSGETCPACSAPREPNSGNFCEICGYNFTTKAHGEIPIAISVKTEDKETGGQAGQAGQARISPPSPPSPIIGWEVMVIVDPALHQPESPEPPINEPPIAINLEKPTNLIGRTSKMGAIYPEIPLDLDDAISRRHALLNRQEDGTFTLRDIGSSNGTKLNGVELKPMVDAPLKDGDEFTLGHWTRIKIKAIR